MNNEFLTNCIKEIVTNLNNIQIMLVAYMGYLQGSQDSEAHAFNLANDITTITTIEEENKNEEELKELIEDAKRGQENENISVIFTEKELFNMPLQFRKEYRMDGTVVRCRKRPTGYNKFTYEMRYRRDGYNVTATAKTLDECKKKFLQKLKDADKQNKRKIKQNSTIFGNFAIYYFENFKKRKVVEETYKTDLRKLNCYIMPFFKNKELNKITPMDCQNLIDKYVSESKSRTAECVHSLLNQIFKGAIKHGYITQNPLDLVVKNKHEREHGKSLTIEQEAEFVRAILTERYAPIFITALYTGMRPNEYAHAKFENGFVITINSKRKNGKVEYKKIPIHPMFAPYVTEDFVNRYNALKKIALCTFRESFYKIIDKTNIKHAKLYDLRTTFYTRCEMCGVADPARNEFVGHSSGILKDTYTDLPDSYLITEGEKINYPLCV